ncbi:aminotransferase [Blastomonas sp. AAP25]|uniref:aminotransferase class V-fold PLP-dependent enzyme n=1 Tax=Blastomonas sp. AAP25 TaxID=1523416 RepID=UPI0006B8BCAA|nr:aminotransferase class V-fold PLP-dependent enzyme [Blastomonas sp. AAP25]KPF74115.1 aminotransferase [Blastomonas sp. AAP25]
MPNPSTAGPIAPQRHLFDIPADRAWFNCAYMSPQLRRATAAGVAAAARKAAPWTIAPADFFTETEDVRRLFGALVGADPACVAIMPSASYGLELAARTLPLDAGQTVLVLAEEFPSNYYPWTDRASQVGATVETVPAPEDGDWTAAVLARLRPGVAIAALPNCHWASGLGLDLVRIGAACRANGTRLALDLTQSCGAMPFSVAQVQPDFMVAATYKWLLGPYSIALAYVAPQWHGARPIEHVWASRAGAEDFSGLVNYRDATQPGARRFDVGERSNFALLPVAIAALEQLLDWQVERIATSLGAINAGIADRLAASGFVVPAAQVRSPHILGVAVPPGASDIVARLAAQQIHVSQRGSMIRISPHLHVSDHDIDRLCDALNAIGQGA